MLLATSVDRSHHDDIISLHAGTGGRYLRERLWGFHDFGADYIRGRTSVGGFVPCCCLSVALHPQKP